MGHEYEFTSGYPKKYRLLGSVYMELDPFGIGTKLVWIGLAFTQNLVDPVQIGLLSGTKWVHL